MTGMAAVIGVSSHLATLRAAVRRQRELNGMDIPRLREIRDMRIATEVFKGRDENNVHNHG